MKKIKVNLMMIAASIAIFGAVATKVQNVRAAGDTQYYWFADGDYDGLSSNGTEQTLRSCNGGSIICAQGYNQSQLVDPNDPSQGVQDDASAQQVLNRH